MMAVGIHKITEDFEKAIGEYTGSPFVVCIDNMSNALWLSMIYCKVIGKKVKIPKHTYPSVASEIVLAGGIIEFLDSPKKLKGMYQLSPFPIWDSALCFTADMYKKEQFICVSFTGAYKHLKLGKGGAILTDNEDAYNWFKRARNSGRGECSYHEDDYFTIGRNCYMHPSVATLGLQLIQQFYNIDGSKKHNEDVELPYPDLSVKFRNSYE